MPEAKKATVRKQGDAVRATKAKIPDSLKPYFDLGYDEVKISGNQSVGICPFCGKQKMYINVDTGQFDCKTCIKTGNTYTFMELYLEDCKENENYSGAHWEELEIDRGIPLAKLQSSGITWDGSRWIIPSYSKAGKLVYLSFYKPGNGVIGLSKGLTAGVALYGAERLGDKSRKKEAVYACEGFWDMLAMELILENAQEDGICIGVPGAGTFKEQWAENIQGRNFYCCYDNDLPGRQGIKKAHLKAHNFVKTFSMVSWPETLPEGYDIRDFYRYDGSFERLSELFVDYNEASESGFEEENDIVEFPPLAEGNRPRLRDVLTIYEKHLCMTDDLRNAIRIIYAIIISNQLPGEPLWLHIVGVPGSCKTELLTSCSAVGNTILQSTLTPHSLISGFMLPGGKDPSLLPRLFDKTFILKDFTEILAMNKPSQEEIIGILRGAYDGHVEKQFGNGQSREYKGQFTMLTGVTPRIYGSNSSSLGERFLLYNIQHVPGADMSHVIKAAMGNSGIEIQMKKELQDAAKSFLEWDIQKTDLPEVSEDIKARIIKLAQLVSMLRATVEKVGQSERLAYRPGYEVGTRLAKQFFKLAQSLGLLNYPARVGEDEYSLVQRVALDSCVGWNRDALTTLAKAEGKTANEISEAADVPLSTIRDHLNALCMLKILERRFFPNPAGRGGDIARFYMTKGVKLFWEGAGLSLKSNNITLKLRKKSK